MSDSPPASVRPASAAALAGAVRRAAVAPPPWRAVAVAANATLALSIVLLPWFALDDYVPNGWDASGWSRGALLIALVSLALARSGRATPLLPGLAFAAFAAITFRLAVPPDFGLELDGLDAPVERRVGAWVALASAGLALVAGALLAARAAPATQPGSRSDV